MPPRNQYTDRIPSRPIFVIGPSIAYIPITKGLFTCVDANHAEHLAQFPWHACMKQHGVYAYGFVDKKKVAMHRYLLGQEVTIGDHINRHTLDNRVANLRYSDKSKNAMNSVRAVKTNRLGVVGVYAYNTKPGCNPRFSIEVTVRGQKHKKFGFPTLESASCAVKELRCELHGEYAPR